MGYETRFKLTALTNRNYSQRDYLKVLAEIDPREFSPEAHSFEDEFEEPRTWYNYKDDMKKLSLKFPDIYFLLYGAGEEQGDVWKAYFCNGKAQIIKATLTFKDEPLFAEIRKDEQFHPVGLCAIDAYTPHKG